MSKGERYAISIGLASALLITAPWFYAQLLVWKSEGHDHMLTVGNIIVTVLLWGVLVLSILKNWDQSKRSEALDARNVNDRYEFEAKLAQYEARAGDADAKAANAKRLAEESDKERREQCQKANDLYAEKEHWRSRVVQLESENVDAKRKLETPQGKRLTDKIPIGPHLISTGNGSIAYPFPTFGIKELKTVGVCNAEDRKQTIAFNVRARLTVSDAEGGNLFKIDPAVWYARDSKPGGCGEFRNCIQDLNWGNGQLYSVVLVAEYIAKRTALVPFAPDERQLQLINGGRGLNPGMARIVLTVASDNDDGFTEAYEAWVDQDGNVQLKPSVVEAHPGGVEPHPMPPK